MTNKNICKLVPDTAVDLLEVLNFILETDYETMRQSSVLSHNRAVLVKEGTGCFVVDGTVFSYGKGTLFFAFSGERFSANPEEKSEYMYISFGGGRAKELFKRFGISKALRLFSGYDSIVPLWYDSLTRASEGNIDLASESILLYTFSRLNSVFVKQNDLINRIIEITEREYNNTELSVGMVAKELSYNGKYISHMFKEKMGMSYSDYLRNQRIKYAVTLFDHGLDSVKNVAFLSGFSDPLYFSTVFKKCIGVSPKEYIKRRT